ncbi:PH domain-containing protein [Entamoeba marina]
MQQQTNISRMVIIINTNSGCKKSNYALPLPFYYSYQFLKSKDFPLTSPLIQPTCFDLSSLNESNFCKEITTPTQAHLIIHHFITSLTPPLIPAELTDAITDAMCRESLLNQVECLEKAFQQAQPPHRMVIILLFHYLNKMYEADYDILDEILDAYQDVFLPPPIISHLKREFVNMLVENYEYIFPNAQNEIEQIVPPDDSLQQLPMTNLSFFVKVVRSKLKVAQSENSEKKTEGSGTQTPTNDQVKLIFKKKPNKTNTFTTNIDDIEQTLKVYSLCDSPRSLEERLEAMKSKISELKQTVFEQDQIIQELQAAYEETQPQQQQ